MAEEYYQSAYTGAQIDNSIGRIVNGEIDQLASSASASATLAGISEGNAANSASAAQNAYNGVQSALNNLPDGDTLIINDLTTGGAKAALSAEMGKTLNSGKVNKSGDTMKGKLTFDNGTLPAGVYEKRTINNVIYSKHGYVDTVSGEPAHIQDFYENTTWCSRFALLKDSLKLWTKTSGAYNTILHTGNKPSGSYTGNGDATERTIEIGGIGHGVLIWSSNGAAIVTKAGGYKLYDTTVSGLPYANCRFDGTNLVIASTDLCLNASGVFYGYQVL